MADFRFRVRLARLLRRRRPVDVSGIPVVPDLSPKHLYRVRLDRARALRAPELTPSTTLGLSDDEWILGAVHEGDARAYPVATMMRAHAVNDFLGGEPFLATYCGRCRSGMAFDPRVEGATLTFDLFGMYQGNSVLVDDQTGTLWTQMDGRAIAGPLAGRHLRAEPLEVTMLGEWVQRHPDSLTPKAANHLDPVRGEGAIGAGPSVRSLVHVARTVSAFDERLDPDQFVIGVDVGDGAVAYAVEMSAPGPQLAVDEVGQVPIALIGSAGRWPNAYDRRVDGAAIDLHLDSGAVVDELGSVWSPAGVAVSGPRADAKLAPVPSRLTKWFGWSALHPHTEVRSLG